MSSLARHAHGAADGDADAVHHMRIALTRLRTAVRFFAPAVDAATWTALADEAAWLSRQSGPARDIDVALARDRRRPGPAVQVQRWCDERDRLYEELGRALASPRYQQLVDALTTRSASGNQSEARLIDFSLQRLEGWRSTLLKGGRKLDQLGRRKRHQLRKRAKRFKYALEWSAPLLAPEYAGLGEEIKQAQAIQDALGRVNDASTHDEHARAFGLDPLPSMARLGRHKSQKRALKRAGRAFEALERLQSSSRRMIRPHQAISAHSERVL